MTHLRVWLLFPILLFALAVTNPASPVSAQQTAPTATPTASETPLPTATSAPTATPIPTETPTTTPAPAIIVIPATPTPAPPPQGNLLEQVWAQNKQAILLGLILAIISGILVGVFLRQFAETLSRWVSGLFHFLFDRFASAPILRWRFDKNYRQTLASALQKLASSNIVDREVRLDRVYVPVGLTEETHVDGRTSYADLIQWDDDRRRRQAARAMEPWVAIHRYHRLVVLGEPGAGKTTYLAHLAFMCARGQRLPSYTPVFLRLRDLAGVNKLEDALTTEFAARRFPNAERFILRRLEAGRCLILLDGLDEVPTQTEHQRVVKLVQEFSDRWAPSSDAVIEDNSPTGQSAAPDAGNIIAVSCRTYSYEHDQQLTGFTKTMVMEFDDAAIDRFVHNWFGTDERSLLADELQSALAHNRRFSELARNPLLLLLITYHYERERSLPTLRAELYKHCIRTRITLWNTQRGTHRGRFGETDKWRMLRELALDIYRQEWRDLLDHEQLLDWLKPFASGLRLPEGAGAAELLDEVVRTSGLLQERAIGRYGFSHLTLQEYFAAEGAERLGAGDAAALLGRHLAEPRWQEVIFLYCGLADHAGPLLLQMVQRAEAERKAGWLQAGRGLAEGARDVPLALQQQVAGELLALLRQQDGAENGLNADESGAVVEWLGDFAQAELPGFVRSLLESASADDVLLAARLIAELPETAEPELRQQVTQAAARLTTSGDAAERRAAAGVLGRVGSADAATVAALRSRLTDPDAAARAEAARALARLGAGDEATVAALQRLHDAECKPTGEDAPRHAALHALLALGRADAVGMVAVAAGEFLMGSAADDRDAESDEKPQTRLYLPAYALDRTPVTNAQYRRFMDAGGYANPAYWKEAIDAGRWKKGQYIDYDDKPRAQPYYWGDQQWNGEQQPVVGVSWYEALAYATWAGKRLPSEAEWEKAARGPSTGSVAGRRYPWGDEWLTGCCNSEEAGKKQTTPVGAYSPSGDSLYGAVDMAGNVWEWCQSTYRSYPYDLNDGREELGGGDSVFRVLRGGSWYHDKKSARCASRRYNNPRDGDLNRGFRCCCATASQTGSDF
jgi:formylglycine-generating enzyme required for sulfatase activity